MGITHLDVQCGDTSLHVRRVGAGPAVLFLHGFSLDGSMWDAQLDGLAERRTCLAPDLRGSGRSGAGRDDVLTMERHADDAAALLDTLGIERADVVGHSMGGYAALAMVERHAARVRSIALVGTRAIADDALARSRRDAAVRLLIEHGRERLADDLLGRLLPGDAPAKIREQVRAMIVSTPATTLRAGILGMRERADRDHVLRALRIPTLILCGERDALTPADESRGLAQAVPHARLEIVPGVGHMAPMEAPEAVNLALRAFLGAGDARR